MEGKAGPEIRESVHAAFGEHRNGPFGLVLLKPAALFVRADDLQKGHRSWGTGHRSRGKKAQYDDVDEHEGIG